MLCFSCPVWKIRSLGSCYERRGRFGSRKLGTRTGTGRLTSTGRQPASERSAKPCTAPCSASRGTRERTRCRFAPFASSKQLQRTRIGTFKTIWRGCISKTESPPICRQRNRKQRTFSRSYLISKNIVPRYICPMAGCDGKHYPDWQAVMRHYIGKKHGILDKFVKETLAEVNDTFRTCSKLSFTSKPDFPNNICPPWQGLPASML